MAHVPARDHAAADVEAVVEDALAPEAAHLRQRDALDLPKEDPDLQRDDHDRQRLVLDRQRDRAIRARVAVTARTVRVARARKFHFDVFYFYSI